METFQLKFQVRSPHQCLMNLRFEVKDMVGDCKVVLQSEGWQKDSILNWKGQPELFFGEGEVWLDILRWVTIAPDAAPTMLTDRRGKGS